MLSELYWELATVTVFSVALRVVVIAKSIRLKLCGAVVLVCVDVTIQFQVSSIL